jgi:hypothetical protein
MFKLLIIINLLFTNSFIKLNIINKPKINMFDYEEFDINKKTFTIIANSSIRMSILLNDLKNHRINYIFIDKDYYTVDELVQICKYYSINRSINIFNDTLVFFEDKKYIGGEFELYQIMQYY